LDGEFYATQGGALCKGGHGEAKECVQRFHCEWNVFCVTASHSSNAHTSSSMFNVHYHGHKP
jgi:hypothetical protein